MVAGHMQALVGKWCAVSIRRDKRNGRWLFRKQVRLPEGRSERIFGVPATFGLPNTRQGAEEAERLAIARLLTPPEAQPLPPEVPSKEVPTVEAFAPLYLEISRISNKPSWASSKALILRRHILPRVGSLRLDEVTYHVVEDFKLHLVTAPRSEKNPKPLHAKTVSLILHVLHRLLTVAKKRGLLSSVPEFEWIRIPLQEVDFLSFDEAPCLVAAARGEWRSMIALALRTGLRRGELRALRWQDVDLEAGRLVVRQNIVRSIVGSPKSGKPREIPLSAETVAMLKAHRHERGPLVFCTKTGGYLPETTTVDALHKTCKKAKLRRTGWHMLRHTFASHLAMRGVPIRVIQELMGHATIQMTMRYAHLSPCVTKSAVEVLDTPRNQMAAKWQQSQESAAN